MLTLRKKVVSMIRFENDGSLILETKDDIAGFFYAISQKGYQEKDKLVQYPVIFQECNDESGHYYVATSPNLQGLVTDGTTIKETVVNCQDAIATLLDAVKQLPKVQDPKTWQLKSNEDIHWITTNFSLWQRKYAKKT